MTCSAYLQEQGFSSKVPPPSVRDFPGDSVNARILNAILRHKHFLLRAENGLVGEVVGPLREAQKKVLDRLTELALRESEAGLSQRLILERRQLETMEQVIAIQLGRAELRTTGVMRDGLTRIAEREMQIQERILRQAVPNGVNLSLTGPDSEMLRRILSEPLGGKVWQDRLRKNYGEMVPQMRRSLATSVTLGEGIDQSVARLRKVAKELGTHRLTLIARSEVQRVANSAAEELYRRNADVVKGMEWIATLDARTCLICAGLDSDVFSISGPERRPPAHAGCRCFLSPVTKSFEEMGLDPSEFPASTRASMNGQVPDSLSYPEWFAQQPESFQRDVLGPSRFELFQQGGLELNQMARDFRVLSIDELPNPSLN